MDVYLPVGATIEQTLPIDNAFVMNTKDQVMQAF